MSYILEALKKSQAERQLGALPTIHAPSLHGEVAAAPGAAWKKPLPLAVVAMAAVIVALLALVWRQPATTAAPVGATSSATPAVAGAVGAPAATAAAASIAPAVAEHAGLAAPATAVAPNPGLAASAPAPALAVPSAAAQPVAMPPPAIEAVETLKPLKTAAAPASTERPEPARKPAPLAAAADGAHAQPSPPAAAPAAPDDAAPSVRELPEPIQRAIPPIAVGGYIYSKNPADRLLLIDKVLRHEGEEVAAGLVLEKLLPKAAVFNYKGFRYRVPY
ncbi:general secretion pathway protein GspB [Rugamonas rubra]|uniref:General secretion pathway protein B n=1 Tax=Rugamonas rubra TaxID=758825 RepID=A0A1I4KRV9_9BURK|nr:general secretion pathway protein GspB [Rugamonas rubra]SFL81552.1 general secretion pathway protein B [Rugamonas rubra]